MKAIKKPIPIEVLEFDPAQIPTGVLTVERDGEWKVFNRLHGSWIGVKSGDYLNVGSMADVYPIDRDTFLRTYDPVVE